MTMPSSTSQSSLLELARRDRVVVRPADAGRSLVENNRFLRDRHAGFRGVVRIVEADGDEVAHVADAGAEPWFAGDRLHPLEVGLSYFREAARGDHFAVDVLHDARQVANLAIVTDDAGFLAAGRAIADKLH